MKLLISIVSNTSTKQLWLMFDDDNVAKFKFDSDGVVRVEVDALDEGEAYKTTKNPKHMNVGRKTLAVRRFAVMLSELRTIMALIG